MMESHSTGAIEMRGRRRGCWDSSDACWSALGEARTRSGTGRLVAGMLVVSLAMLALPAALLADDDRDGTRALAESGTHFTSDQERLLKIAKIEVKAGARGRTSARGAADGGKTNVLDGAKKEALAGAKKDWLFSAKGLGTSIASKEKLLLNLLRNLDQPCDNMCQKNAGKDVSTLHFCRAACRQSKVLSQGRADRCSLNFAGLSGEARVSRAPFSLAVCALMQGLANRCSE